MVETGMICPDCDGLISFCDHALKRLTDPVLAYQGKVIGELQDDLAEQRARADAALMALIEMRAAFERVSVIGAQWPDGVRAERECLRCGARWVGLLEHSAEPLEHAPTCVFAQPAPERGKNILEAIERLKANWDRLTRCVNEFEPEDMSACGEHREALDEAILSLIKRVYQE